MGLLSKQEPIKPKYTSLDNEDLTVGEGFEAAGQFATDVVEATAAPFRMAGHTIEDIMTNVPVDEIKANRADEREQLDYKPTNKLAQDMSASGQDLMAKGATAFMSFVKDPENAYLFGYMPEGIEFVQEQWNKLPEKWRIGIGAGADVGEVLIGGGLLSRGKQGFTGSVGDLTKPVDSGIFNDIRTPTVTPKVSAPQARLPASRTQHTATIDELGYTSGIEEAIVTLINDPKTHNTISAANLLNKLTGKNSKVKEDEIEWSTYSDWLKEQGSNKVTLDEALKQAKDRAITLEVIEHVGDEGTQFSEYSPAGGSNYKELKFQFDVGTGKDLDRLGQVNSELGGVRERRHKMGEARQVFVEERRPQVQKNVGVESITQDAQDISYATEDEFYNTPTIDKLEQKTWNLQSEGQALHKKIDDRSFKGGHWEASNIIFHARITDREIGGGNSLAIDEIQSDWHQGKGSIVDRPYYKLPEDKLEAHIETQIKQAGIAYKNITVEMDAAEIVKDNILRDSGGVPSYTLYNTADSEFKNAVNIFDTLQNKQQDMEEALGAHRVQLVNLRQHGYENFTRGLRPNAPLKNKDKWMGAILNAMLYKAVKGGYDSVSWPNGKTNSSLYEGLNRGQRESLEKMYDVTVPTMLSKMVKKIDKEAKVEFGKKSADSNPKPKDNHEDAPVADQEAMEADFAMHERAFGGLPDYDMTFERFSRDWVRRDEFGTRIENGTRTEDWQLEEDHATYLQNIEDAGAVETPDNMPYTLEEYKEKFGYQEYDAVNSAYSHIKLTPKMKESILKGQPLFLAEGGLVAGYKHGGLVDNEMEALNLHAGGAVGHSHTKDLAPVDRGDTDALEAAIIEMRRKEAAGEEYSSYTPPVEEATTFYDKDDQDFTEIYGTPKMPVADTEEPALEPLEATPTTAIAETKEILTEPVVAPDRGLGSRPLGTLDDAIEGMVYSAIKKEENGIKLNWNKTTKKWLPHKSAEGGTHTIAYGHKFATQAAADAVTASGGITEEKAIQWFKDDMDTAEAKAKKEYEVKYPAKKWSSLDTLGKLMLTEVVFNIGTLKDKKGVYDWPKLSVAVQDKDYKVAKGQLSRKYTKPDKTVVSLTKRTAALKAVYAQVVPATDWTK